MAVDADQSLTEVELPLISIACLLLLVPVVFRVIRQDNRKAAGVMASLLLIVGIAAIPFGVAVSRPSVIAPVLTDSDAKPVLHSVLSNVYRAFDFREEEDVYDKLAHSVSGDLLTDVYLQSRKSMQIQRAGGAQARVKEVEVLEVASSKNPGKSFSFDLTAKWSALGSVGHWGHVHTRKNVYDALVTLDVVDGAWKITGLELLEEQRVDPYAGPAAGKTN